MELLNLAPSRVSLEFSLDEWPVVARRLKRFGAMDRERFTTFDGLKIGSEEFVFVSDEDTLALISQSARGDLILRRVVQGIRARFSARDQRLAFRTRAALGPNRVRLTRHAA